MADMSTVPAGTFFTERCSGIVCIQDNCKRHSQYGELYCGEHGGPREYASDEAEARSTPAEALPHSQTGTVQEMPCEVCRKPDHDAESCPAAEWGDLAAPLDVAMRQNVETFLEQQASRSDEARSTPAEALDVERLATAIFRHRATANAGNAGCDHHCAEPIAAEYLRLSPHNGEASDE